jgi:hypothetical protein
MPRVLSVHRAIIPAADRRGYVKRLAARRDHYQRAGCRFWVFEEAALPGAYIEFTEAPDSATLAAAHAGSPERPLDPARVYNEVEMT